MLASIPCRYCGATFRAASTAARYCSPAHRAAEHRVRQAARRCKAAELVADMAVPLATGDWRTAAEIRRQVARLLGDRGSASRD